MHIHPYGWLLTVPLTLALIQLAFAPRENIVKRAWWMLREAEAEAWFRLGRGYREPEFTPAFKAAYVAVTATIAAVSFVSFFTFIEVLPAGS